MKLLIIFAVLAFVAVALSQESVAVEGENNGKGEDAAQPEVVEIQDDTNNSRVKRHYYGGYGGGYPSYGGYGGYGGGYGGYGGGGRTVIIKKVIIRGGGGGYGGGYPYYG